MAEVVYPNVWGPGQLFAFSGIDGETDWFHPFVATTLSEDMGLLFHLREPRRLWCEPTTIIVEKLEPLVVTGDCIEFSVESRRGGPFQIRYLFLDRFTVIGETSVHMPARVRAEGSAMVASAPDVVTHSSRGEHTALVTKAYGEKLTFAFSFSPESEHRATDQARQALLRGVPGLLQRKLLFYTALPERQDADERRRRTVAKAFSVLKTNLESPQGLITHRWSTPDRLPHRDMWLWDSCFHSVGYRLFSTELATEVLKAVLGAQHEDGFLAHRVSPAGMSEITQPPLLAWAFLELFRPMSDCSPVSEVYPQLCRFIDWLLEHRRAGQGKLLAWRVGDDERCRCPESGMDNSPRFDAGVPLQAVDFNAYVVNEMNCLADLALLINRKDEAEAWRTRARELSEVLNELLWDETDGFYYDRTLDGEPVRLRTSAGFLPLFAGVPDRVQAWRLLDHLRDPNEFWTAFPVPSVARDEPSYELDMWRGPTWLNIDLLIVEGLVRYGYGEVARELAQRVRSGVEHWYGRLGSIDPFYDPDGRVPPPELDRSDASGRLKTGEGTPTCRDYSGSAACYLALVTGIP